MSQFYTRLREHYKKQNQNCSCDAYSFSHRKYGGKCEGEQIKGYLNDKKEREYDHRKHDQF